MTLNVSDPFSAGRDGASVGPLLLPGRRRGRGPLPAGGPRRRQHCARRSAGARAARRRAARGAGAVGGRLHAGRRHGVAETLPQEQEPGGHQDGT